MVAYIYSSEQHQSCICWYAHSITPHIAMVMRELRFCQRIRCGRLDKHRTRRVDADGRPDCMGNHGQCGLPWRGRRITKAQSGVTNADLKKLSNCEAAAIQVVSRSRDLRIESEGCSPRPVAPASESYQAHGSVCACGEPPERSRFRRTSASDSSSARKVQFSSSCSNASILLPGCPDASQPHVPDYL